jgi:hypothetical protein
MKNLSIIITLLLSSCALFIQAQEKFTGIIEYKTVSYNKDGKPAGPDKLSIVYGTDKAAIHMEGVTSDDNGWILVNTRTDSVYMIDPKTRTYERESLFDERGETPLFIKTDSVKTFFGYTCRGYKAEDKKGRQLGYIWLTENITWSATNKNYQHPAFWVVGGKHLLLSLEMYENGSRVGAYFPVSLTKMEPLPDSLLDYSGYKEKNDPSFFDEVVPDSVKKMIEADTTFSKEKIEVMKKEVEKAVKEATRSAKRETVPKTASPAIKRKSKPKYKAKTKVSAVLSKERPLA